MRNINLEKFIDIKELLKTHNLSLDSVVDINIGCDHKVYLLFNHHIPERIRGMFVDTKSNSEYSLIVLTVDWNNGEMLDEQYYKLGTFKMNYHYVQPIGENFLLLGARAYNTQPEPEKNATVVSKDGTVLKEMCLGDGIQNCIVTEDKRIITGYFDEGVFGNYGWDEPIGSCGLIVWDENGQSIWKANYPIYDCYAMNVDDRGNLWFYYYDEFALVKTNFENDVVYQTEIEGAQSFLLTEDAEHILFDGGYNKHSEFRSAKIDTEQIADYQKTDFVYEEKSLLLQHYIFRGSRAVLVDNKGRLFAVKITHL